MKLVAVALVLALAQFSARREVVRVDVLVTDNGRIVRGLTAADFDVRDLGIAQQVDFASFEELPLNVALALDMSSSVAGDRLGHLRTAVRSALRALKPADKAGLVTFSHILDLRQEMTPDVARVSEALDAAEPTGQTALVERGLLHGEVDVRCEWAGVRRHGGSLSCADLNLSSQAARRSLANHCADRARTKPSDFDWMGVIDSACLEIIRADRGGAEAIVLDDAPDVNERDFDVCGLCVPADAPSMLIAHGDSLKSLISLMLLGTLAKRGVHVLYLDWEWNAARHRDRKRRLFGNERLEALRYVACRAPLVHEVDRIRRYCDEHHIEFVAVDSVGLACDGKLIDDDVAIRFHRALGLLPPALCAAHVPKSSLGPDGRGDAIGPFGSVFFSNLCRASWLVKKQPGETRDVVTVGLFQQKQNNGGHPPVGLEFSFDPQRIRVRQVDLATVDGLSER